MTVAAVDFASLLCSRLCHDLLSPVGAMNNGLELLADEQDAGMRAQVMELLADSAAVSANKLKFFRLAFGAAGGFGDAVDTREAQAAIAGLVGRERKVEVEWLIESPTLSKTAIKVLLNLVLMASDALVRGGRLIVGAETRGRVTEIVVRAEGPRLALDEEVKRTLGGETAGDRLTPKVAPAWLVHSLATETGGHAQVLAPDGSVLLFGATLNG